ncbi:hypothetical protein MKW94_015113, partial [Papaver nudicaule]|nr:hypothetical protein [Papaver nudicaule]
MRNRANAATLDFTEVLPEEIETRVKAAAVISNGCELKEPDFQHIDGLCDLVLSLNYTRAQLFDDMRIKLNTVAPNLTALVGELVAARLIAKGGGIKAYSRKVRRKMARSLGAKIALAIRCDALGDTQDSTMGLETRAKLEARLRDLEAIELARSAQ